MISLIKLAWSFTKSNKKMVGAALSSLAVVGFFFYQEHQLSSARDEILRLETAEQAAVQKADRLTSDLHSLRSQHAQTVLDLKASFERDLERARAQREFETELETAEDTPVSPSMIEVMKWAVSR